MRSNKYTIPAILISLVFFVETTNIKASAIWNLTLSTNVVRVSHVATYLDVSVYIQTINGSSQGLGISNFVFSFNTSALSYNSIIVTGTVYGHFNATGNYNNPYEATFGSNQSINTDYTGSSGGGTVPSTSSPGDFIGTIRFNITDSTKTATVAWDHTAGHTVLHNDAGTNETANTSFSVLGGSTALPITLSDFSAIIEHGITQINWTTASEINNDYFTVQRSQDGKNFVDLFNRNGAGNSNKIINYVAYDAQPLPGTSYYRLKQTDFNGANEIFNMVSVYNPDLGTFAIQSVSPTVFNDNANLNYQMPADGNVQLVITNMQGKVVEDILVPSMIGYNTYTLTNTGNWGQGVYFVNMIYDGRETNTKMVKN